jgi:hypothetical protein
VEADESARKNPGVGEPELHTFMLAVHPYCQFGTHDSLFRVDPRGIINPVESRCSLSPYNFYIAAGLDQLAMILYARRMSTILRTIPFRTLVTSLAVTWQESCENPSVFCYRVGRQIFARDAN